MLQATTQANYIIFINTLWEGDREKEKEREREKEGDIEREGEKKTEKEFAK